MASLGQARVRGRRRQFVRGNLAAACEVSRAAERGNLAIKKGEEQGRTHREEQGGDNKEKWTIASSWHGGDNKEKWISYHEDSL